MNSKLYETGRWKIAVLDNDWGESESMKTGSLHEEHVMSCLLSCVELSGGVVIDVGAGYGGNALPFADAVGKKGRVFAIEIQPVIFQALCANIFLNNYENITAINAAATDCMGQFLGWSSVNEYEDGHIESGSARTEPRGAGIKYCERVPSITIDSLELDDVRLMKLDCEGNEINVLRGAVNTIQRWRPMIFCELSSVYLASQGLTITDAITVIRALGYDEGEILAGGETAKEVLFRPL